MAKTAAEVGVGVRPKTRIKLEKPPGGSRREIAVFFMIPALVFLGAIVIYPTIDTFVQSFQNDSRTAFVGVDHYQEIFRSNRIVTAIKNNVIWVATAPAIITGLGLIFAVLTERVRYATALKVVLFMPMAISFLSTGVIWRIMYEESPQLGFINAGVGAVYDVARGAGSYPNARALPDAPVRTEGRAVVTEEPVAPGEAGLLPLVGMTEQELPQNAAQAAEPEVDAGSVGAVVWRDFKPGGGRIGEIEDGELGLPGVNVEFVDPSGEVAATAVTGDDGTAVARVDGEGPFSARVPPATFSKGFQGVQWLGESLVTPAIVGAFAWMWVGFALVVIGAGLSALPRDVLEAARTDGASEWQVFRHVTMPLLAPVLGVVFVTLVINVLKIFDIVLVMAPGAVQDEANVIALEMYKTAFTARQYGLGSTIAVLLFLLVIPAMLFNVRRFRREN